MSLPSGERSPAQQSSNPQEIADRLVESLLSSPGIGPEMRIGRVASEAVRHSAHRDTESDRALLKIGSIDPADTAIRASFQIRKGVVREAHPPKSFFDRDR